MASWADVMPVDVPAVVEAISDLPPSLNLLGLDDVRPEELHEEEGDEEEEEEGNRRQRRGPVEPLLDLVHHQDGQRGGGVPAGAAAAAGEDLRQVVDPQDVERTEEDRDHERRT